MDDKSSDLYRANRIYDGRKGVPILSNALIDRKPIKPRILLFSQSNIFPNDLWRCPYYEFEEIIREIDAVEVLAPRPKKYFPFGRKFAVQIANHARIALNPGIPKVTVKNNYDMLFVICSVPRDLLNLNMPKDWKNYCKVSVCLMDEIWVKHLYGQECYLKLMSQFDYVMLYYSQSVKSVGDIIGSKCVFLPPGVDAIRFCPYPEPPKRVIDVYSIGRRSDVTHQKLLKMAKEKNILYVYDSIQGQAINSKEHRLLFANMAKRSRYFIVNPGLIDRPDITGNQSEIGNRYFEGAAAGTIMVGETPKNDEFKNLFGWPDAVTHLSFGSDNIDTIMNELDSRPDQQEQMRRNNVIQSLRRHDWVYRWEAILKTVGLDPLENLSERKERLENISRALEVSIG